MRNSAWRQLVVTAPSERCPTLACSMGGARAASSAFEKAREHGSRARDPPDHPISVVRFAHRELEDEGG